ncbi:GntR family transcriptional regulator [Halomonas sp. ANAO-440]|uniref:GntR family transcriptional regulator n=1 Tax=Halomonas sp. ANAO-440 TaxID=2861360 RepID=UPI001CAA5791|nr:GntR family transcriptional regulator [Halomonas sp. ANAO-440]MBZ0331632.1 GntR family transcriptional regulator [Halomonas sp. ANAO-440]
MEALPTPTQLVQRVHQSLLDAICSGELPADTRLNQDSLAKRLGVSRQPIVQAIQLLKNEGFVCAMGRRGVKVAPLSAAHVRHLYQVRASLDALAAREAALHAPDEAQRHGQTLLEAGRQACASGQPLAMIAADMAFHRLIYRLSGNPLIEETVATHWHHLRRAMGAVIDASSPPRRVWEEHSGILDAVVDGDASRAEQLARQHAEQAGDALAQRLTRYLADFSLTAEAQESQPDP